VKDINRVTQDRRTSSRLAESGFPSLMCVPSLLGEADLFRVLSPDGVSSVQLESALGKKIFYLPLETHMTILLWGSGTSP